MRRTADRLRELVGEHLEVEARHARGRATGVAERLAGRRLEAVDAHGKNLLLRFEGGYVLRNHLRMSGSWRMLPRESEAVGQPWLILRGSTQQAMLYGGSILELSARATRRLGPDILADPPDLDAMIANLRRCDPHLSLGEALLDQRAVAGIGNVWRAEALWQSSMSPWRLIGETSDAELRQVLSEAARLMRRSIERGSRERAVYRRSGRPCQRCGERIRARGQGDDNRTAYWCPQCQTCPERSK